MADDQTSDSIYHLVGFIMLAVFIVGLILNGSFTLIFISIYRKRRSCTNLLIFSLSICNLLHVLSYPLNFVASFRRSWDFGQKGCVFDAFWVHWMAITSISHLTMLALDRYLVMNKRNLNKSNYYKYAVVIGCWFYGMFWSAMPLVGWSQYGLEGIGIGCSIVFGSTKIEDISYNIVVFVTNFALPILIIACCYLAIYRGVREHHSKVNDTNIQPSEGDTASSLEKKLVHLVISMVAAFVISWTPYAVVCLLMLSRMVVSPVGQTIPAIVAKASVCYFPIIYGFKHTEVQKKLRNIMAAVKTSPTGDPASMTTDQVKREPVNSC